MKTIKHIVLPVFFLLFVLNPHYAKAETGVIKIELEGKKAEITLLQGTASLIKKEMKEPQRLSKGDFLTKGDRVITGKNSRIEIKLPDNSFIRFDELTTFELESVAINKSTNKRNINIRMILGKTWAKVSKLFSKSGRFSISTKTAVAGVRGTVYRVNVKEDNSAIIKVYWGEVSVKSLPVTESITPPGKVSGPEKVSGPSPVTGPHPVTMKEWKHILQSMQQIIIHPDGTATKPFRFAIASDKNDWVNWNQSLDERLKGTEYQVN